MAYCSIVSLSLAVKRLLVNGILFNCKLVASCKAFVSQEPVKAKSSILVEDGTKGGQA